MLQAESFAVAEIRFYQKYKDHQYLSTILEIQDFRCNHSTKYCHFSRFFLCFNNITLLFAILFGQTIQIMDNFLDIILSIFKIEMEKVPNLDIFSHRQLKKSSSLSRFNHDSSSRSSSAFQPQRSSHIKKNNYYDQAVKMLNLDSKISSNLRNIENRQEQGFHKTNLKRVTKNHQIQRQHATFANNPQVIYQGNPPEMAQTQQVVKFSYPPQIVNRNVENIHPPQVVFPQNPTNFMNQTAPQVIYQQGWLPPQQPNINMRMPQNQHIVVNHFPPQSHLQRTNSAQNLHFHDYSQPDKVLSTCKIEAACNNEEQQKIKKTNSKGQQYTFRNEESVESSGKFKVKPITLNPFLFDATYLLEIKQSENRLPDMSLVTNNRQCNEQMQKKKDLIEQLIEIKQANQIEGHNILRQLDSLIEQFDTKAAIKDSLEESQFRSSRRSMFSRIQ